MEFLKKDKEWEVVAREAYKAQKRRKEYEEIEKKLLAQLKELSENQNCEGSGFRFQRIDRRGSVDYAAIPELKLIDLEQYRRDGIISSWKLFKY